MLYLFYNAPQECAASRREKSPQPQLREKEMKHTISILAAAAGLVAGGEAS